MLKRADAFVSRGSLYHHQQLVLSLSISKGSVSHIIQDLGYSNVCLRWGPWSLTVEHKTVRNVISCELFTYFEAGGETFLFPIVTADETWDHHFELEKKGQFMELHHA
jgi:hypothetical protein